VVLSSSVQALSSGRDEACAEWYAIAFVVTFSYARIDSTRVIAESNAFPRSVFQLGADGRTDPGALRHPSARNHSRRSHARLLRTRARRIRGDVGRNQRCPGTLYRRAPLWRPPAPRVLWHRWPSHRSHGTITRFETGSMATCMVSEEQSPDTPQCLVLTVHPHDGGTRIELLQMGLGDPSHARHIECLWQLAFEDSPLSSPTWLSRAAHSERITTSPDPFVEPPQIPKCGDSGVCGSEPSRHSAPFPVAPAPNFGQSTSPPAVDRPQAANLPIATGI